ncbi:MAG TPA: NAD-dependent protein deacylase [Sediminispirochaeta sp.]|nr:NAD-dependent protein deacylase [Sediminispirochaeta sp.]
MLEQIEIAADIIKNSRYCTAFTGAGISVESGIPPFRGENGIWNRYDPRILELRYFSNYPEESWRVIKEIFYDYFGRAAPNRAHRLLAEMEEAGMLESIITQNIDNLHHEAGSREVIEFHGNSRELLCTECGRILPAEESLLKILPPRCRCGALLKPNFVFFGETIPTNALSRSEEESEKSDCMLLIGTTGEVYPAAFLPRQASMKGASIIEINPSPSLYTSEITDVFIRSTAVEAAEALGKIFFST